MVGRWPGLLAALRATASLPRAPRHLLPGRCGRSPLVNESLLSQALRREGAASRAAATKPHAAAAAMYREDLHAGSD